MTYLKYFNLAALGFLLCACSVPALIVGQPGEETGMENVQIFFHQRPACNFDTIALIRIEGGYYSLAMMLNAMRRQAAEVGAGGLYVLHTEQLELKEYIGSAKAIRCLSS